MENVDYPLLIRTAHKIAFNVHSGQEDKAGFPYIAHVEDVASRVAHLGEEFTCVALLHDVLEDCSEEDREPLEELINHEFDDTQIPMAVRFLTKQRNQYREQYLFECARNSISKAVKIADASHNFAKLHYIDDKATKKRLRDKYIHTLETLTGVVGHHFTILPIEYCRAAKAWGEKNHKFWGKVLPSRHAVQIREFELSPDIKQ